MGLAALSLKARALRYLAQREHSRAELERKLARHLQGSDEADARQQIALALDQLAAAGLLSDARVAEALLAGPGQRLGSRRLRHLLQSKGLAAELVSASVQQARPTELERAREVWHRRFGAAPADAPERARQMRFLAGRGFDSEVIRRIVQGGDDD